MASQHKASLSVCVCVCFCHASTIGQASLTLCRGPVRPIPIILTATLVYTGASSTLSELANLWKPFPHVCAPRLFRWPTPPNMHDIRSGRRLAFSMEALR
ncbi:hypothetical protein LZ32DRAFT_610192 [Colletotrichum eremochloae]|nr:hypothetical protein LZ32DRAFT_610192 [Colletotrichum eremochloae]